MTFSFSQAKQTLAAIFMTMAAAAPVQAQNSKPIEIDTTRQFNMQVQETPVTAPQNPAFRVVKIDCSKLQLTPNRNNFIITKEFAAPFDLPPYYTGSSGGSPAAEGTAMLTHLGSRMNEKHQICVAHSEMFMGVALRQPESIKARGHKVTVNGRDFYTSVPVTDDRYCAPMAAAKMCTQNPEVQRNMSPVYRFNAGTNTLEIVPENL